MSIADWTTTDGRVVEAPRLRFRWTTPIELMLPGHGEAGPTCGTSIVLVCHDQPVQHPTKLVTSRCMRRVCPDCGPHLWAWREAMAAHQRLVAWMARVGRYFLPHRTARWPTRRLLRHVTISEDEQREPQTKEDLDSLYHRAYEVLGRMGFWGGIAVFHPFRHDGECAWTEGPHIHVIGFGYVNEGLRPAGWVVRDVTHTAPPTGRRRSWPGTLKYALDHGLVPRAAHHRYHSERWFGALAPCKFSSRRELDTTTVRRDFCTVCGADMVPRDQVLPPDGADAREVVRWVMSQWRV